MTRRHFEYRQEKRKQEIDDLVHRIDQMKVAHARRNEQHQEIIKRRIADLLNEDNELKWDETRGDASGAAAKKEVAR